MRLPDFIIGGAPRSGTTWLRAVLDRHPDIAMAQPARPEPKFFLVDELWSRGLEYYSRRWFESLEAAVVGEKSTNYLESDVAAARMSSCLPTVRIVFVLREPAERAYSNYRWSVMNGLESLSFADAVAAEPAREAAYRGEDRFRRPYSYVSRGEYARLLRPWLERFPRDAIHLLSFDDIVASPGKAVASLHRFLGVDAIPGHGSMIRALNDASPGSEDDLPVLASLREKYRASNRELRSLLGRDAPAWT